MSTAAADAATAAATTINASTSPPTIEATDKPNTINISLLPPLSSSSSPRRYRILVLVLVVFFACQFQIDRDEIGSIVNVRLSRMTTTTPPSPTTTTTTTTITQDLFLGALEAYSFNNNHTQIMKEDYVRIVGGDGPDPDVRTAADRIRDNPELGESANTSAAPNSTSLSQTQALKNQQSAPFDVPPSPQPRSPQLPSNLTTGGRQRPATKSRDEEDKKGKVQASIVVNLSGELGNNLHHIAHGIGLQEWLRQDYGVETNIVIRHFTGGGNGNSGKWKKAWNDIQACFPILATWDFSLGNSNEFLRLEKVQQQWLQGRHDHMIGLVNSANLTDVDAGLRMLAKDFLLDSNKPYVDPQSAIQLPFLASLTILDAFPVMDRHFDAIHKTFAFDHTSPICCARLPTADETVFHFRNYMSELPDWKAYDMGFSELSPNKTAYELFGPTTRTMNDHQNNNTVNAASSDLPLSPGDKVTVTSRVPNKYARAYAERLNEVWQTNASLQYDQTGLQDFCYLMHTQHELVGNGRSTYLFWAAALGQVQTARLYHVDTFGLRQKFPDFWRRFTYPWTHLDLQRRIHWELYQAEEVDEKEGPLQAGERQS